MSANLIAAVLARASLYVASQKGNMISNDTYKYMFYIDEHNDIKHDYNQWFQKKFFEAQNSHILACDKKYINLFFV